MDAGLTWEKLTGASNKAINDLHIIDSLTVITVGDQGKITKTTDGGNTWYEVSSPTFLHLSAVCFPNDSTGYAVGGDKGFNGIILKSFDRGETWDTLSTQFEGHLYTVVFIDSLKGYAAGSYSMIYKTISGGQLWAPLNNPNQGGNHHIRDMAFSDFNTGFTVDIHGHILRTFNAGATWDSLYSKVTTALYTISINEEGTIFSGGFGGMILRSPDTGLNWQPVSAGPRINLVSIDFPQSSIGFITGSGGLFSTENAGQQWDYNDVTELTYAVDAHFLDGQTGYVLDVDGAIFKTIDGGDTWTVQNTGVKSQAYKAIYMVNPMQGYAVGGGQSFSNSYPLALRTLDGENWTSMPVSATHPLNDVAFINSNKGYLVGNNGTLQVTNNGGNIWESINIDSTYNFVDISFLDQDVGFIVGNKQGSSIVYRTGDGGNNWQEFFIPQGLKQTEKINAVRFADEVNGFAVGTHGLIFKTINGGESWFRVGKVTNNPLNDIYPRGGFDGFIVGTGGTLLRMDPVVGIPSLTSEATNFFSISPNPSSDAVTIRCQMPDAGYRIQIINIDLYTMDGKRIRELVRKEVNPGLFEMEFDVSDLPAGIYIVRVQAGNSSATQKLIIR
jgi:photosystem II stability/assembly factor-like uncharacterized protein